MRLAALLAAFLLPRPAAAGSWILLRVEMLSGGPLDSSKALSAIRGAGGDPFHWSARDGWYGVYDVAVDALNRPQLETVLWDIGAGSIQSLSEALPDDVYRTIRGTPIRPYQLYLYFHVDPKASDSKKVQAALKGGALTESKPDEGRYWALVQREGRFASSLRRLQGLDDVRLVGVRPLREGRVKAVGDRPAIAQDLLGTLDTCHVSGRSVLKKADAPAGRLAFEAVLYDESLVVLKESERVCSSAFRFVPGVTEVTSTTSGPDQEEPDDLKGVVPTTVQDMKAKANSVVVYMDPTVSTGDAVGLFEKHGGKLLRVSQPGIYVVGTEPGQDGRFIEEIKQEDGVSLAVPNAAPRSRN